MRFFILTSFAIIFFTACSNFDTVENKDESGKLIEKFTLNKKTQKKEGAYFAFYASGQKKEESFYLNDSLNGERKLFYENGQIESITTHANGMFEGKYQKYNETGKLLNEGQYVNNEMSGVWKKWYDTGELQEEVTFVANQENGPFKEFFKNGKLETEGVYVEGENEQGELKIYDENGELTQKMYCEFGNCAETWSKENGEQTIDTARIRKLALMKKAMEASE
ncbi:MAG: toxin-antitoxin system YwqK family antitoxin [Saprospiraceae bacterium]|nr:toxin-antitoxin system YwqK family antitoxin [Saprospiraceae bacterium]MCF8248282.1 toxin-antitoxin system YwqK family antitoxin [Saprospiraceae bacterium]MCF8279964.1 toxin-antitoxin system YwqK family antitoxin [Bacteroidales bacterium]MCF8309810.1 toxin-antitoxin system YwqK family antitoxin [Saprospiraceae bacterium]MCF8438859.1 toxin-antitoxin system YwqK family antitoxin [Saprospiraceae bacterium]